MTHRQRFQTVLEGDVPDRTPWVPRLNIWYQAREAAGTLPAPLAGRSLREAEACLGMGHSARKAVVFREEYENVERRAERQGEYVTDIETPVGTVSGRWHDSAEHRAGGMARTLAEPYVKLERDYDVLCYVAQHTRYRPAYDEYRAYDAEVGEDGYPLVILGPSPIHTIMLRYVGYENFFYHLADHEAQIRELLEAMEASYRRMWEVVADSPARFVLHGVHFSSDMTPPPVFDRYFMPYFEAFNARMHQAGIKVAFHADADLTGLLERVRDAGFDVADTFACAPLVKTAFEEAWGAWQDRLVIWGGVPSIILEPTYPEARFQAYMRDLWERTAGRPGFIMAVSDNIMPPAEFSRLVWIRDNLVGIEQKETKGTKFSRAQE